MVVVAYDPSYQHSPITESDYDLPELSNSLIKLLKDLSPKDFKYYIQHKIPKLTKYQVLLHEQFRRKTFIGNWTHGTTGRLDIIQMAKAGFYKLDDGDEVQCAFCFRKKRHWKPNDSPPNEHVKLNKKCHFLLETENGNIECDQPFITNNTTLRYSDLKDFTPFNTQESIASSANAIDREDVVERELRDALGISTTMPVHLHYAIRSRRRETFIERKWPRHRVPCEPLCDAGFVFTGWVDQVVCFYCSITIRRWKAGDDPWLRHAQVNKECPFLTKEEVTLSCNLQVDDTVNGTADCDISRWNTNSNATQNLFTNNECLSNVDSPLWDNEGHLVEERTLHLISATQKEVKQDGYCKRCQTIRPNEPTLASFIGLPCRHLIYCERCNHEIRAENPTSLCCPFTRCLRTIATTAKSQMQ